MCRIRRVVVAASLFAVFGTARAQEPAGREILDAILEPVRAKHDLPALAAAIVSGPNVTEVGAVGRRRADSPEEVTIRDRWHLGSCTKAMTATLAAILVDRGILSWETTLGDAFDELADSGGMNADWRDVTLADLLAHRGGMPQDLSRDGLWRDLWDSTEFPTRQREILFTRVLSWPPAVPPRSAFLYSNAGYAVAGAILERKTGQSCEELLLAEIFAPLAMDSAGFGAPGIPGAVTEPRGHVVRGEKLAAVEPGAGSDNPEAIAPAGTVHATIEDWAKFVALHLAGARGEARLVTAESFARLHTPPPGSSGDYALGWGVARRDWAGGTVLTHSGSNTMWFCVTWIAPQRDLAVVVATNRAGDPAQAGTDEAAWALIQRALAED